MIIIPRINKLRLFNLKVKKAKFIDLLFDFQGKNTYIHAGNATGKSATIGFILNTLSPYKQDFPKGDSRKKRYLSHYVQKDRPGAIIIEWMKDVQENHPQTYLLTGQIVIMRNNDLVQLFFIKEYTTNGKITIDHFPFVNDGKYNNFSEIRKLLRLDGFKIVEPKKLWVNELEKHYIDHGLIKRLLTMNETENSTKEGISFRNKRGFINYIIDDIIPVPSHAEELISSLRREYTLFNEIPRYEQIIEYLKEIRALMKNNESLPEDFVSLYTKIEVFLNSCNMIALTCSDIRNSLNSIRKDTVEKLSSNEEKLKDAIQRGNELTSTFRITSLQYYKKLYRIYKNRLNKFKTERNKEEELQEFFSLYAHFRESNELKEQIKDLEEKMNLELGPLESKLEQLKIEFEDILIQSYQYSLYELNKLTQKMLSTEEKNEKLIETKSNYKAELRHSKKNRNDKIKEINEINKKIKKFQAKFDPKLEFLEAITQIKSQIKLQENDIEFLKDQLNLLKQEIEGLRVTILTSGTRKSDIEQELKTNQKKIDQVLLKWESLIRLEGFIQEYGSLSKDLPAYHLLSKQNQKKIEEKIDKTNRAHVRIRQEISLIAPKLDYYEKYDSFPTSKEIDSVITLLRKEGIITHKGWEYYDKNRTVIDGNWIKKFPFLFEGIIVQDSSLQKLEDIINELEIFAEFPIYITKSNLFLNSPMESEMMDKFVFLEKSIIWKHDIDHKDVLYKSLKQQKLGLDEDDEKNRDKLRILKELRDNIQGFLQFTDSDKFLQYQENIVDGEKKLNELVKEINKFSALMQRKENRIEEITEELHDLDRSLSELLEEQTKARKLKIDYLKTPAYKQEITKLTKIIPDYYSKIQEIEEEKIPEIKNELKTLNDQIMKKNSGLSHIERDYKEYFTEELIKTKNSKAPIKYVADVKTRYLNFKNTIEDNQTIKEITKKIKVLMEQRNRKETIIDGRCEVRKIDRNRINRLWENYRNEPNKITSFSESNREKINELIRKEQRANVLRKQTNSRIKEVGKDITEDVKDSLLSLRDLKFKRENLEQNISHIEIMKESLQVNIDNSKDKQEILKRLNKEEGRISDNINANSPLFYGLYKELKEEYNPSDIEPLVFDKKSLESIGSLITKLEQKERLLSTKQTEITTLNSSFNQKRNKFYDIVKELIREANQNDYLKDYDVVTLLPDIKITQIPTMEEECENDILQRERELEESKRKLKTQVDLLKGELVKCLNKINQFQNTKINIQSKESFSGLQPIKIQYRFNLGDIPEMVHGFLNIALTSLHDEKEFPEEWSDYHSLVKSLLSEFLENQIKEVRFLLPHGDEPTYSDFDQFMLMSGGQTATIAIILYCYIAHYKIKYKRKMHYQDLEIAEKVPLSFPYISDNPMGNANLEELVRLQLDVAKSLNVQLIYFSGIKELANIEEFETVIPVQQSANSTVYIPIEEKYIVEKGPTIHHTPIREENFGEH